MRVGLIGFGRAGKTAAKEILSDDTVTLSWVLRKTQKNCGKYASLLLGFEGEMGRIYSLEQEDAKAFFKKHPVDLVIDFSCPEGIKLYSYAARAGAKIISAISHYSEDALLQLKKLSRDTAVIHGPNITLGINFLMAASKVLQRIAPAADVEIIEQHFRDKKEVSGTALRLADKLDLCHGEHVNSIRVGEIVGKHEVVFGLPHQTIRIVHESLERGAFGEGALHAAKWLHNKPDGFYTMEQVLGLDSLAPTDSTQLAVMTCH